MDPKTTTERSKANQLINNTQAAQKLLDKYPDRIPILVATTQQIELTKNKFLCPRDSTIGHFQCVLRKHITNLRPEEAIFIYFGSSNAMMAAATRISQVYAEHCGQDHFLHAFVQLKILLVKCINK